MATPDNLLISALHGTAWRAAVERRGLDGAIGELRRLAQGRNDLLAEAAGVTAGFWLAGPDRHVGHELVTAGMLIMAAESLDYDLLSHWVRIGYERGGQSHGPIHGRSTIVATPNESWDPRS